MKNHANVLLRTTVAIILYYFEVFIGRISNLMAHVQTWSLYNHNTAKYLIGIATQGVISYISKGWGGHISSNFITEYCGIFASDLRKGRSNCHH